MGFGGDGGIFNAAAKSGLFTADDHRGIASGEIITRSILEVISNVKKLLQIFKKAQV